MTNAEGNDVSRRQAKETTKSVTVKQATLDLLRAFGIRKVFGNPGSTELPFLSDWPDDIDYVLGLQEASVIGMADGYAQATRNAGFVNLHSAAGVGNALGNIYTAHRNQTPLVITAGQQARSILPLQAFLYAERASEFPRPYVKYSVEPARAEDVPAAIARAYYVAMQPPCGPTFVSIPIDDWDVETEALQARPVSRQIAPAAEPISRLARSLAGSRKPVFVVGAAVDRDGAWQDLVRLAEMHGALVWVSPLIGRCSFPEDHRLFAGHLPAFREEICARLAGHDLLVAIGAPVFTYHAEGQGPYVPPGLNVFQLSEDPDWTASALAGEPILGSVGASIASLLQAGRSAAPAIQQGRAAAPRLAMADRGTAAMLLQTLADLRSPDSIIVEEAPSTRPPMQRHLPILQSETFYTCSSGGLGHAMPA